MFDGAFKNQRVLVTGHTGFKGTWLSEWLLELGAEVAGYALEPSSTPSLFTASGIENRMIHHIGDVRDSASLARAVGDFKPVVIFHLAAQAIVRDSYDTPRETFDTNVMGTVNLLEAFRKCKDSQALVVVTTDKCYENLETDHDYREGDRLGGHDPYSASKAAAEIATHSYMRSFFRAGQGNQFLATARGGNVIGGGDWSAHRIVADCARAWSRGEPVLLRHPQSTRPWQHVLDCLSGYLTLGAQLLKGRTEVQCQSFNFGPKKGAHRSVAALVEELQKTWPAARYEVIQEDAGAGVKHEAKLLQLDISKAKNVLGWDPSLDFTQTAQLTARWYSDFYAAEKKSADPSYQISIQRLMTNQIKTFSSLSV